jgi:hypothetical protein
VSDLVDYLREKLTDAETPRCTCAQVDVGWPWAPETTLGRRDPACPFHGDRCCCDPLSRLTPDEIDIIADTVRRRRNSAEA